MSDSDYVLLGLCLGLIGGTALIVALWIMFFD